MLYRRNNSNNSNNKSNNNGREQSEGNNTMYRHLNIFFQTTPFLVYFLFGMHTHARVIRPHRSLVFRYRVITSVARGMTRCFDSPDDGISCVNKVSAEGRTRAVQRWGTPNYYIKTNTVIQQYNATAPAELFLINPANKNIRLPPPSKPTGEIRARGGEPNAGRDARDDGNFEVNTIFRFNVRRGARSPLFHRKNRNREFRLKKSEGRSGFFFFSFPTFFPRRRAETVLTCSKVTLDSNFTHAVIPPEHCRIVEKFDFNSARRFSYYGRILYIDRATVTIVNQSLFEPRPVGRLDNERVGRARSTYRNY